MANKITVNKVSLVPDEPGDEPGMPTFWTPPRGTSGCPSWSPCTRR